MKTEHITKITSLLTVVFVLLVNIYPVMGQKLPTKALNSSNQFNLSPVIKRAVPPAGSVQAKAPMGPPGSISVNENALYNTYTPTQLVQNLLISRCIRATNVTFNGAFPVADPTQRQLGYFDQAGSLFPMGEGLVLSSGYVTSSVGPNNATGATNSLGLPGDPDLTLLAGAPSYDAAVLEFDFVPSGNMLEFEYIFSSEEYLEFCCSPFNDAFGFFLSGPGITGPYSNSSINLALLPSTAIPVTINNVHSDVAFNLYGTPCPAQNASYYIDNPPGTLTTEFDGMTVVLKATYSVVSCASYHIKLAVGDVADDLLNSAVFLQARSFSSSEPVIICPNDTIVECGTSTLPSSTGVADASDNCILVDVTYADSIANGICTGNYIIYRTWTVTNACGNTASCIQKITIVDIDPPLWDQGPNALNATVACNDAAGLAAALALAPTATDLCSAAVIGGPTQVINPGLCLANYTITRTWTLADDCGNIGLNYIQTITVQDNAPPSWSLAPGALDRTLDCDDIIGLAIAMALAPTATDICSTVIIAPPSLVNSPGSCAGNYRITRTWVATDACGNSSNFRQVIRVRDNTPPVLVGVPGNITVQCNAIPAPASVSATDNCGPDPAVSMTETTTGGTCPDNYRITRTWTATDACTNVRTGRQVITVIDNTPPVIITCAMQQSATANALCQATVPDFVPFVTATDNCSPGASLIITQSPPAGSSVGPGINVITITVTDLCNNNATCTTTFTVSPEPAPVIITQPADQDICLGANAGFSITGSGTGTLFYQWQVDQGSGWTNVLNGGVYSGAVMPALNLTSPPFSMNGYQYRNIIHTCSQQVISQAATLTIYPNIVAGSASASQVICYNSTPGPINATPPTGGDGIYTYQWQSSTDNITFNDIPGATALSYSPGVLTQTTYYRQNQNSGSGCSAVSTNVASIRVQPNLIAGVASANQTICYNAVPAAIISTPPTGGDGNYTYQWQVSFDNSLFVNIPGATTLSYSPGALTRTTYYRQRQASGSGCGTVITNVVIITVNPDFIAGVASSDQAICLNGVPAPVTATSPTGGNGSYTYQWQISTDNITFNNIPGANSLSYSPGSLSITTWYRQRQTSGSGCGTTTTNVIIITVNLDPSVAGQTTPVCSDAPTGIIFSPGTGVPATSYNITNINSNGLSSSAGNPVTGTGFPANEIADDAWTNPTLLSQDVVYTVVPLNAAGCPGIAFVVTIQVLPEPSVTGESLTVCSDMASGLLLNASSTIPAAGYNITNIFSGSLTASAGNPATGSGFAANVIADDAWTNTGNMPANVIYTVVPVGTNGCAGNPFLVTLTVNPEPVVDDQMNNIACSGTTKGIILGPGKNIPVSHYNITSIISNGLTAIAGNPVTGTGFPETEIADDAWINTTSGTANAIYTVVPFSNLGCAGNVFTVTIVVPPDPVTDFTANAACWGDSTLFTVSGQFVPVISLWHWDFGDGTFWSCNSPGCATEPHEFPFNGTYPVTMHVTDTNGCEYEVTHPVTVLPLPVSFFSYDTPDCMGSAIQFTDLSLSAPDPVFTFIRQWEWDFGDGTPPQTVVFPADPNLKHTYAATGTYHVTLTITNSHGCRDTYITDITVTQTPDANFTYDAICQDAAAAFQDISTENGGGEIISWAWDFGDPASGVNNFSDLQLPTHIFATPGNFVVSLVTFNFNGCSDTLQQVVTVKPSPDADFSNTPGCIGNPTEFTANLALVNAGTIATCLWDFGDGSTATTPVAMHSYPAPGNYIVLLTITDTAGCEGIHSDTISVTTPPYAHFSVNHINCISDSISFSNLSTTGTGYINSWSWDFGDGNVQTINFPANPDIQHNYSLPGTYNVTLTVVTSEGCTDQEQVMITVNPGPIAGYIYHSDCGSETMVFSDISYTIGNTIITSWSWNFGDPASGVDNTSNLPNPSHTFTTTGIHIVSLITNTANACSDTVIKSIVVGLLPSVDFVVQGTCHDFPAQFSPDAGVMNLNTIASWLWQFGDGITSTAQNPRHIYTIAGSYNVTLSVTDTAGCTNNITHTLQINPLPFTNFDFTAPSCQQSVVGFTDLSTVQTGNIVRWVWNFGDGTTQAINFPGNPTTGHAYATTGSFNVTLTVKTNDSCTNQVTKTLSILAKPTAVFTFGTRCKDVAVRFTDLSAGGGGFGITQWTWNFGDPASGINNTTSIRHPLHIFNTAGSYTVTLIVSNVNGCSDTSTQIVTVTAPPVVNFSSLASCSADTTRFTSSTFVNMATTQSWQWQFGDGATATTADPGHIYIQPGTFTVTLTITDISGCTNTISNQVNIPVSPYANFGGNANGCVNVPVTFNDLSNGNGKMISLWHMDFGDATDTTFTVVPASVTHTYTNAGNFIVTLTVETPPGCTAVAQHITTISPAPSSAFSYTSSCRMAHFTDQSLLNNGTGIVSWRWDFGDPASGSGNTSTLKNPMHTFTAAGNFLITYVVTNAAGCMSSLQSQIFVPGNPPVDFLTDDVTCLGKPAVFRTDSTITNIAAIQAYNWNFGDGTPGATQRNPTHTFTTSGTYTVTLSVTDNNGCGNSQSHQVTFHELPTAAFSYSASCGNSETQFTDYSFAPAGETITGWKWEFGDQTSAGISTLKNPVHTYSKAGIYYVTQTVYTAGGCSQSITLSVRIWDNPTARFTYIVNPCSNGQVQFEDSSYSYQSKITDWRWDFEPYQYSVGQRPAHQFNYTDSCYNVKLIVANNHGCIDSTEQQVCVPAPLTVTFSHQQSCYGSPMQFTPQLVAPAGDNLLSFNWNFGDPQSGTNKTSSLMNPTHTFSVPGLYTVYLTSTDQYGCSATTSQSIAVNSLPAASFTYIPGLCDNTIHFTSTSAAPFSQVTSYNWNYGDGLSETIAAPINTVSHQYAAPGIYDVTLTVENQNSCQDNKTIVIQRNPCMVTAFRKADTLVCQNTAFVFNDMSTCEGTISQWQWTWDDNSPPTVYQAFRPSVSHTFAEPGIYSVTLEITTMATGVAKTGLKSLLVQVMASPRARFETEDVCLGATTKFRNTTYANGANDLTYKWEFGDLSIATDAPGPEIPEHKYTSPGAFDASLVVTNESGCADTAQRIVKVNSLPSAVFDYDLACPQHPTRFISSQDSSMPPIMRWDWMISDNIPIDGMTGAEVAYTFDKQGIYTVQLAVTDTNRCVDTASLQVVVNPAPVSAFSFTENYENEQGKLHLTNGSVDATNYSWDFGNGLSSSAESPVVLYEEDGKYLISLRAANSFGCVDSTSVIYDFMVKGLYVPNAFAPTGTVNAVRLFKPVGVNLATYTIEVYDTFGNLIWSSSLLDDKGSPVEGWNGTYKDKMCQQDVYVWKVRATFRDGTIWSNNDTGVHGALTGEDTYGTVVAIR